MISGAEWHCSSRTHNGACAEADPAQTKNGFAKTFAMLVYTGYVAMVLEKLNLENTSI